MLFKLSYPTGGDVWVFSDFVGELIILLTVSSLVPGISSMGVCDSGSATVGMPAETSVLCDGVYVVARCDTSDVLSVGIPAVFLPARLSVPRLTLVGHSTSCCGGVVAGADAVLNLSSCVSCAACRGNVIPATGALLWASVT